MNIDLARRESETAWIIKLNGRGVPVLGCLIVILGLLLLGWMAEVLPPLIGEDATNVTVFSLAIVGWSAMPRQQRLEALAGLAGVIFGLMMRRNE